MKPLRQTGDEAVVFPRIRSAAGFTLIEMIGALAIVVILTAAVTPVAVRRVDIAARMKEYNDLSAISNAVIMQVIRSNNIPGTGGAAWAGAVANWLIDRSPMSRPLPENSSGFTSVDPNITPTLPYTQSGNSGLAAAPANACVMVVSSIARTNVPPTINFNETWNWNNVLSPTAKPASWSTFPGNGDDVCIQRINLGQMFYQLVLVNRDQSGIGATNAPFTINGTAIPTIITNLLYPNGQIWNNYYLWRKHAWPLRNQRRRRIDVYSLTATPASYSRTDPGTPKSKVVLRAPMLRHRQAVVV